MSTMIQRLSTGGIRIAPGNERTQMVRRQVANLSGTVGARRRPHNGLLGSILKGLGKFGSQFAPGGGLVSTAIDVIAPTGPVAVRPCPSGFERGPSGNCLGTSFRDRIEQFLPGGQTGTLADVSGVAVMGAFGIPALQPTQVGQIMTRAGEMRPILRCNRGMVLGTDNLCYPKAILTPRSRFRKHRRAIAPPISRRDVKAIRTAAAARDRVKELAQDVGFTVIPKGAKARKKKGS